VARTTPDGGAPEVMPSQTDTAVDLVLDDFSTLDTAVMEIMPPGLGRSIGKITFAGPNHPKTVRWNQQQYEKTQYEERQRRLNPRWQPPEKTKEQTEEENARWLISRMVDWDIKDRASDGSIVQVPFTEDAAMKVLRDPGKSWLYLDCLQF